MNRRAAYPFLTIPDEAIHFGGWMIGDPGEPLAPVHDVLEDWDYERDIEVAVQLNVDFRAAAQALGIVPEDLALAVVLKGGSGAGSMPRWIDTLDIREIDIHSATADMAAQISSRQLSGRLRLEVAVLLRKSPTAPGMLSPKWIGARLWQNGCDILLEDGGDSRFPIELADFSRSFASGEFSRAPWYLDWRAHDLNADFGGSVRVYVNSSIPEIAERFVAGDPLTLQSILGDVMSQMIGSALDDEDCEELLDDCAANTVGHQIRNWLDLSFPGQTVSAVRSLRDHFPGRFRAAILAAAEVDELS